MTVEDKDTLRAVLSEELDKRFPPPLSLHTFSGYELIVLTPAVGATFADLLAEAAAAASLRKCEVRFSTANKWYKVLPGWTRADVIHDVED
jgi:hypothetical protein